MGGDRFLFQEMLCCEEGFPGVLRNARRGPSVVRFDGRERSKELLRVINAFDVRDQRSLCACKSTGTDRRLADRSFPR